MVIGAFPAAKLGALLMRQISKPIANAAKEGAKSSPVFRKYVCMPPAQFYNWCEVKCKMWVLNLGRPVNIPVLNEAMAIELGANLLGEGIIFIIAASLLMAEYSRSSRKEAAKEKAKKEEMSRLQNTITELYMQTEAQATQIKSLSRYISDFETRVVQKPWAGKKDKSHSPVDEEGPSLIIPIITPLQEPDNTPPPSEPMEETGKQQKDNKKPPRPPQSPPPAAADGAGDSQEEDCVEISGGSGVVLKAVHALEKELWRDPLPIRKEGL